MSYDEKAFDDYIVETSLTAMAKEIAALKVSGLTDDDIALKFFDAANGWMRYAMVSVRRRERRESETQSRKVSDN